MSHLFAVSVDNLDIALTQAVVLIVQFAVFVYFLHKWEVSRIISKQRIEEAIRDLDAQLRRDENNIKILVDKCELNQKDLFVILNKLHNLEAFLEIKHNYQPRSYVTTLHHKENE